MSSKLFLSYNSISGYNFTLNYGKLLISILFVTAGFMLFAYNWLVLLRKLKHNKKFKVIYNIWTKSQLFKYIPGLVWTAISRAYLAKKIKIGKKITLLTVFLEFILMILSALLVSAFFILSGPQASKILNLNKYYYLLLIILCFVIIHPIIINHSLLILSKIFKTQFVKVEMNYFFLLKTLVLYIFAWIIMGSGFYFVAASIVSVSYSLYPIFVSIFCFAWSIGFLIIFIPGGLGIREAAIWLLLSIFLSEPISIIIAFVARIWWIIGELISYFIGNILKT